MGEIPGVTIPYVVLGTVVAIALAILVPLWRLGTKVELLAYRVSEVEEQLEKLGNKK